MEARRFAAFAVMVTTALVVTHALFLRGHGHDLEQFTSVDVSIAPDGRTSYYRDTTIDWDTACGYFPYAFYERWKAYPSGGKDDYKLVRADYANLGLTLLLCGALWAVTLAALRAWTRDAPGSAGPARLEAVADG